MEFISMENIDSMATEVVRLVHQLYITLYAKMLVLEIIDLNNENILSLFLYSALTLSTAETGSGNSDVDSLKSRRGNGKEPLDLGSGSRNRRQNQLQSLPKWKLGTQMPSVRARACAVATDDNTFYVIGMYSSSFVN